MKALLRYKPVHPVPDKTAGQLSTNNLKNKSYEDYHYFTVLCCIRRSLDVSGSSGA